MMSNDDDLLLSAYGTYTSGPTIDLRAHTHTHNYERKKNDDDEKGLQGTRAA